MRTVAILPVKSFPAAKQRLRDGLDPERREALVRAMFTDVLDALGGADLDGIVVVTASLPARRIAIDRGAEVLTDHETGHNAAAALGIRAALERGAERTLLVPGDCPALDPQELNALLEHPVSAPSLIVVPDRHGTGTNALLITPPDALAPSFGPGSCQRHMSLARAAGIGAEVVRLPSLGLDIDTPEDVASLAELGPERASRTRLALSQPSRC
jgi:2-phospho-L-lactate/phosphoenolpyruvate guanylyltransferase